MNTKEKNMTADTGINHQQKGDIVFENSCEVCLSFVALADPHIMSLKSSRDCLSAIFEDINNSKERFDTVIVAGDIADLGRKREYQTFFSVFDKEASKRKIILATGNHDIRFNFKRNSNIVIEKAQQYLNMDAGGKYYYSYDINGYTFIVLGSEKRVFEKAYISDRQLIFLDSELNRATKNGKPAFVICHQPFKYTHGLPEVWKRGDLGEQSDKVREIVTKYKNVFFLNGHLHGGVYENTTEIINGENNVYSISVPSCRKSNHYGIYEYGLGQFFEIYKDHLVFTARNFTDGKVLSTEYVRCSVDFK